MCDGLARNLPGELDTILANCLAHGRRNFVELLDRFPEECRHVIESFKIIYHNDKVSREKKLSAEARLVYHQTHSSPTMDDLHVWLQLQFDNKLVEPNSALGDAINYLLSGIIATASLQLQTRRNDRHRQHSSHRIANEGSCE